MGFAQTCSILLSAEACSELGFICHRGGTVVCIEGPRYSSKAESKLFRSWGADLVNMTIVPEVVLATELGEFSWEIHIPEISMPFTLIRGSG